MAANEEARMRNTGRLTAVWDAVCRGHMVVEFDPDGRIVWCNESFLDCMGYRQDELVGRHHRIFCAADVWQGSDYAVFWNRLGDGACDTNRYSRVRSDGSDVWLQASYSPILDREGQTIGIIKIAQDVTAYVEIGRRREADLLRSSNDLASMERNAALLGAAVAKIAELVRRIREIALNAKVISLNAAIEAARTEGGGAGLRAITQEIRALVDETRALTRVAQDALDETARIGRR